MLCMSHILYVMAELLLYKGFKGEIASRNPLLVTNILNRGGGAVG